MLFRGKWITFLGGLSLIASMAAYSSPVMKDGERAEPPASSNALGAPSLRSSIEVVA